MFSNIYKNNNLLIFFFGIYVFKKVMFKRIEKKTFDILDKKFITEHKWEDELKIYNCAMPKIKINIPKRKKCLLLISGYRDIPSVWNNFTKVLDENNIDYFAPRTFGNGRKCFQDFTSEDWIITYLESIYLLQDIYEEIDIIGYSTGAVIALYLTQFQFKCKIKNLFLVSPFLLYNKDNIFVKIFYENYFSPFLNQFYKIFINIIPKTAVVEKKDNIDAFNEDYTLMDFANKLINFIKFRPSQIFADNISLIYSKNDKIIGSVFDQHKILFDIFKKNIDIIEIEFKNIDNTMCTHSIFKFDKNINNDVYNKIKKYF